METLVFVKASECLGGVNNTLQGSTLNLKRMCWISVLGASDTRAEFRVSHERPLLVDLVLHLSGRRRLQDLS